ncbi:MAG: PLP-dependent aminotransferase family protein [Dongiaceae bacterium]
MTGTRIKYYIVTMTIWIPNLSQRVGPRYLAIVDTISDDLEAGRLSDGERLPTHRELAYQLGVTVGTVTRAYAEAERRGLIVGEVGRGTFVRAGRSIENFPMPDVRDGGEVIDLSMNYPTSPEADAVLSAGLRKMAARSGIGKLLEYQPYRGRKDHRITGSQWLERRGLKADPEQIVVTAGGQNAMFATLAALAGPGDVVLTESVTYPGIKLVAGLLRIELVGVAMDAQGILPDEFDRACRDSRVRALFCMPTLQNPGGSHMPVERRRVIAEIACRHGVRIVEDNIYGFLIEDAPPPLVSFAPELGFYLVSLSKAIAPGLRVGFVAAPPGQAQAVANVVRATTLMASPPMAELASQWIADGTGERLATQYRIEAKARQMIARSMLQGLTYDAAAASFHLWLTLPEHWTPTQFAAEARQRGVVVTPAEVFAIVQPVPRAIRLCLSAARDRDELRRALAIITGLAREKPELSMSIV